MIESTVTPTDHNGLFGTLRLRLLAFIRQRLPRPDEAEDVFQEIFTQFVRVDSVLDPIENPSAWLFRAARNEITDLARKRTEIPFSSLFETGDDDEDADFDNLAEALFTTPHSPEDGHLRNLLLAEIDAALSELTEVQREVFIKTELEGFSFKELAEQTGENINTLLARKHKAVVYLRMRLRDIYEEIMGL